MDNKSQHVAVHQLKLGHRLEQIAGMVTRHYTHIWDCCCDHGLLGFHLMQRGLADTVHFLDSVAPLVDEVEAKLKTYSRPSEPPADPLSAGQPPRWAVHCQDLASLVLPERPGSCASTQADQLIIIAGVGGEKMVEFISAIQANNPGVTLEFLLCPVRYTYHLRQALIGANLGLISEQLVWENKRFYELIHVSSASSQVLSPVGSSQMWDLDQSPHRRYLDQLLSHYRRLACAAAVSENTAGQAELVAYKALL
jgi:tRNA (adenine22-N1)-methyltransferase